MLTKETIWNKISAKTKRNEPRLRTRTLFCAEWKNIIQDRKSFAKLYLLPSLLLDNCVSLTLAWMLRRQHTVPNLVPAPTSKHKNFIFLPSLDTTPFYDPSLTNIYSKH